MGIIWNYVMKNSIKKTIISKFNRLVIMETNKIGHDFRYGVKSYKINKIIKVKKFQSFDISLKQTINWYLNNKKFLNK